MNKLTNAKPRYVDAFEKIKYELLILVILLIFYIPQKRKITDDLYMIPYILDYRVGFAPRLFIGSVMSLFTQYKSIAFMEKFMSWFFIFSVLLCSFVAGRIIRKASEDMKEITIFFVALFLAVPYSISVFYSRIVSVDRFEVVFTIIMLMVIKKPILKWFVPVLIFMALATYHQYAFMYMPIIAILLIYEIHSNNYSKQSIFLCTAGFLTMAVFSAYFYLYSGISGFKSVDDLLLYTASKTDIKFNAFLKLSLQEYFLVSPMGVLKYLKPLSNLRGLNTEVVFIVFIIPLILIFFTIWKNSIKNSKTKFEKFIFILCTLAPVARLPMFVLTTDHFRQRASLIVVQFFLLFYFLYNRNTAVTAAVRKVKNFFEDHYFAAMLLYAYNAVLFLAFVTGYLWWNIIGSGLPEKLF